MIPRLFKFTRPALAPLAALLLITLGIGLAPTAGCAPCDQAGCDALGSPARDTGASAVAGMIAYQTDVVANGCQECGFSSTMLSFWKTPALVTDTPSAMAIVAGPPTATLQADKRYQQLLDPGSYLVCVRAYCAGVDVLPDHVTTVHVKMGFGPAQFVVFDPGTRNSRSAARLEVGL